MKEILEYDIRQSALLADMTTCLNHYRLSTPGLYVCVHPQVQITEEIKVTPSLIAQVNSGLNKQCHTGEEKGPYDRFFGPPNFVFDVFRKDQKEIYESRRSLFEQCGVIEYVAWFTLETKLHWNRLHEGSYIVVDEDEKNLIQSSALPGLWFPIDAVAQHDMFAILAKISQGITRREHHDFMNTVWKKKS
ncbi:hypothetical protein [Rubellicoccus peritrichatus]|uniref:Restriction endonuclease domain-containing protein n=1 Tax=Rubellicoccus peritrichatus TaxID=3080537 RepID=A0AAQ3QY01_9BACT|nr:hypothetical protein [Puniceicoccus sp. CR14]WOO43320.1 hypothetical protein RZN69_09480 [Puniceicoccus sp. CR14]